MKHVHGRFLAVIVMSLLFGTEAFSQFEITPYTGYMFGGRAYGYYNEVDIQNGQNFGIHGNIEVYPGVEIELMYNRMVSEAVAWNYLDSEQHRFDLASEYFMVGALKYLDYGKVRPFFVFTGGVSVHTPQDAGFSNKVAGAINLGAGVKIFLTDYLGIRLQGRMLTPLYFSGVGVGCGIGTGGAGCGGGVGLSSTLIQGDFNGGIILRLGGSSGTAY